MKIRLSKFPFWSFVIMALPLHAFFLGMCVYYLVRIFAIRDNNIDYRNINALFGTTIFLLILILVFYVIRIKRNPELLILTKKEGRIFSKKKELYKFSINNVRIIPDYEWFILALDGQFGETELIIRLDDGRLLNYKIGINRFTFWRLKKYLKKYQYM